MSVIEKRDEALSNFRRANALSMGVEERKLYRLGGQGLTMAQVEEEMKRNPPTALGIDLIRIWSMPLEEVQAEIAKAKATLRPA